MSRETETKEIEEMGTLSSFKVKIDVFEGPFDLLLHLIDDGKIDIYAVSLKEVTFEYLNHLKVLGNLPLDQASEFLIMAAYLIEMKSKRLLPIEEKEIEEVQEIEGMLLNRLHEYKVFKELASHLQERKEIFGKSYFRYRLETDLEEREIFLTDVSLRDLILAFKKVWELLEARGEVREIPDELITVGSKTREILGRLAKNKKGLEFASLFTRMIKLEVIITFLAILELARQHLIQIKQGETFGSILVFLAPQRGTQ